MRGLSLLPTVLLSMLAACGADPAPAPRETVLNVADAASSPAEADRAEQVTAIDAATGDGRRMPADWDGPSAYDVAASHAPERARVAEHSAPVDPEQPGETAPAAADLPDGDDALANGV